MVKIIESRGFSLSLHGRTLLKKVSLNYITILSSVNTAKQTLTKIKSA
jgi:hypothetical protein